MFTKHNISSTSIVVMPSLKYYVATHTICLSIPSLYIIIFCSKPQTQRQIFPLSIQTGSTRWKWKPAFKSPVIITQFSNYIRTDIQSPIKPEKKGYKFKGFVECKQAKSKPNLGGSKYKLTNNVKLFFNFGLKLFIYFLLLICIYS